MKRAILGSLLGAGLVALGVGVFDQPTELPRSIQRRIRQPVWAAT